MNVKVRNVTRNTDLGHEIRMAESLVARAIGLLATPSLESGQGLWLSRCSSVHSFFMRYPIDILFLDAESRVLFGQTLRPWRLSPWVRRSHSVLELPAGTLDRTQTTVGDQLVFEGRRN